MEVQNGPKPLELQVLHFQQYNCSLAGLANAVSPEWNSKMQNRKYIFQK